VTVTATNVATNVASTTTTNSEGDFQVLFLNPGTYALSAELSGFKKIVRTNLEVRVGEKLGVDLTLEVGTMSETVSVTAESPMLVTTSGSTGQTISEKTIAMMPLSDGNPFALARLAPGIAYNGDLKFSRPFDNGGTSGIVTGGASGGNEFTLDGSPNMANGRRVAFVPPAGAVQEFKVETASFDAASGHTGGRHWGVNVTLKSGTEQPERIRLTPNTVRDKLAEKDFFVIKANAAKAVSTTYRPRLTFGGPVVLPCTTGHRQDRSSHRRSSALRHGPRNALYQTVPTQADAQMGTSRRCWRRGASRSTIRKSAQRSSSGHGTSSGTVHRATALRRGTASTRSRRRCTATTRCRTRPADAGGRNNFFYENPRTDDFYSVSMRFDHTVTAKQRLMGRYTRNDRRESRNAVFGQVGGIVPTGNFLFRKNDGVTLDHTWTQSSNSLWDIRGGWQQFREPNVRQHEGVFDPASLGFSSSVTSLFGGAQYFPLFDSTR
jgi:hypothetical protein